MGVTIQEDMLRPAMRLPDNQPRDFIFALVMYGIYGVVPDEDEPWFPMWEITQGRIDASVKRNRINAEMNDRKSQKAAERKSQRENPKGTPNGKSQRENPKDEPKDEDTDYPEDEPNSEMAPFPPQSPEVRKGEVRKGKEKGGRALKRFTPPSPDEVAAYAKEQCLNIDPVRFCDYYESCGWVVGRNRPMKDWKAAARRWSKNEYGDLTQVGDTDDYYDFSALDRRSMGDADADLPF